MTVPKAATSGKHRLIDVVVHTDAGTRIDTVRVTVGFPYNKMLSLRDGQHVGEAIWQIQQRDGACTRDALLEAARPVDSKIHHLLTWDQKEAAEKWRQEECSWLIRAVHVDLRVTDEKDPRKVVNIEDSRAFFRGDHGYENTAGSMRTVVGRQAMLDAAAREADALVQKYKHLEEFAEIVGAVRRFQQRVKGTVKKVAPKVRSRKVH